MYIRNRCSCAFSRKVGFRGLLELEMSFLAIDPICLHYWSFEIKIIIYDYVYILRAGRWRSRRASQQCGNERSAQNFHHDCKAKDRGALHYPLLLHCVRRIPRRNRKYSMDSVFDSSDAFVLYVCLWSRLFWRFVLCVWPWCGQLETKDCKFWLIVCLFIQWGCIVVGLCTHHLLSHSLVSLFRSPRVVRKFYVRCLSWQSWRRYWWLAEQ